jgi:hypothetical protein
LIEGQIANYRRWVQAGASMTAYPDPKYGYRHMGHEMWWNPSETVCCNPSEHLGCSRQRPTASLNFVDNGNLAHTALFGQKFMQKVHQAVLQWDPSVNPMWTRAPMR